MSKEFFEGYHTSTIATKKREEQRKNDFMSRIDKANFYTIPVYIEDFVTKICCWQKRGVTKLRAIHHKKVIIYLNTSAGPTMEIDDVLVCKNGREIMEYFYDKNPHAAIFSLEELEKHF